MRPGGYKAGTLICTDAFKPHSLQASQLSSLPASMSYELILSFGIRYSLPPKTPHEWLHLIFRGGCSHLPLQMEFPIF